MTHSKETYQRALDAKAAHLTQADIERIGANEAYVRQAIDKFPDSWAKARRQADALFLLIQSSLSGEQNVSLEILRYAAGSLLYLSSPLDLVPDDEEGGFADDAAVLGFAIEKARADITKLCQRTGKNAAKYLD